MFIVLYLSKKNLPISGPAQLKPMSLKGEVYVYIFDFHKKAKKIQHQLLHFEAGGITVRCEGFALERWVLILVAPLNQLDILLASCVTSLSLHFIICKTRCLIS